MYVCMYVCMFVFTYIEWVFALISCPRSFEYMKLFHHLTLGDSRLDCSSKKDFMSDRCCLEIIGFPYFFIQALREIIVGKNINI